MQAEANTVSKKKPERTLSYRHSDEQYTVDANRKSVHTSTKGKMQCMTITQMRLQMRLQVRLLDTGMAPTTLVERFDVEPFSDFSAK